MAGTSAAQSEAVDTRRGPTGDSGRDSEAPARLLQTAIVSMGPGSRAALAV